MFPGYSGQLTGHNRSPLLSVSENSGIIEKPFHSSCLPNGVLSPLIIWRVSHSAFVQSVWSRVLGRPGPRHGALHLSGCIRREGGNIQRDGGEANKTQGESDIYSMA